MSVGDWSATSTAAAGVGVDRPGDGGIPAGPGHLSAILTIAGLAGDPVRWWSARRSCRAGPLDRPSAARPVEAAACYFVAEALTDVARRTHAIGVRLGMSVKMVE